MSRAVKDTFERRGTDVSGADYIFSEEFAENKNKQKQWQAFLRKNNLNSPGEFTEIMAHLKHFLNPVVEAIRQESAFNQVWDFMKRQWSQGMKNT